MHMLYTYRDTQKRYHGIEIAGSGDIRFNLIIQCGILLPGTDAELIRGRTLHADTELLHHLLCHFDIRHPVGTLYLNRKIFRG